MIEVKIKNKIIVQPAEPSFNGHMTLTELDILGSSSFVPYTTLVYFYKPNNDECSLTNKSTLVRDSLSLTLVHFYPFAGRLMTQQHGSVVLQCGDACVDGGGAVLIEAESNNELADFGDFSDHGKFRHLMPSLNGYDRTKPEELHKIPLLLVQLTSFRCGGLSLGTSISHLADGFSSGHFMKEWARISRGHPLEKPPFMDRTILLGGGEQPQIEELHAKHKNAIDNGMRGSSDSGTPVEEKKINLESEMITTAIFYLTKTQVEKLKNIATTNVKDDIIADDANNCPIRPYSRYEVITAHTWRCVCKAKGYKDNSDVLTKALMAADLRGRLQPPLPAEFFGNAITRAAVTCPAGQILSNQLAFVCKKLRQAIDSITNDSIRSEIEYLRRRRLNPTIKKDSDADDDFMMNMDIFSTNWLQLPICGLEFGWGKEICMRRAPHKLNGAVIITSEEENVAICLQLQKVHMDNFSKFFYEDLILD